MSLFEEIDKILGKANSMTCSLEPCYLLIHGSLAVLKEAVMASLLKSTSVDTTVIDNFEPFRGGC